MGAFTSALAPILGATRLPLNVLTVLLGLAGMALGGWLLWMSRFFTGPDRPAKAEPASTPSPARPNGPDDDIVDDATVA
jgi:hypothetical protein